MTVFSFWLLDLSLVWCLIGLTFQLEFSLNHIASKSSYTPTHQEKLLLCSKGTKPLNFSPTANWVPCHLWLTAESRAVLARDQPHVGRWPPSPTPPPRQVKHAGWARRQQDGSHSHASASPRPHSVKHRPRDARAGPNPPDFWHSWELHVGAGIHSRPMTARVQLQLYPTLG